MCIEVLEMSIETIWYIFKEVSLLVPLEFELVSDLMVDIGLLVVYI